jgi:inositol transport system substrate-binding protein
MDMCAFINVVDRQTANWSRDQAQNLRTHWLSPGAEFDAVFANNDEVAIGAIQAMQAGDLDVTVFQDAAGQGSGAIDAAVALAAAETVETTIYIPFQLVTLANVDQFLARN